MKQITTKSIHCFLNAIPMQSANMEIKVLPNVTIMLLHGNEIAYRYKDPKKTISITNCGWFSNTTKERLNSIPSVNISQKDFKWYLNGVLWDGKLIDIL